MDNLSVLIFFCENVVHELTHCMNITFIPHVF